MGYLEGMVSVSPIPSVWPQLDFDRFPNGRPCNQKVGENGVETQNSQQNNLHVLQSEPKNSGQCLIRFSARFADLLNILYKNCELPHFLSVAFNGQFGAPAIFSSNPRVGL